MTSKKNRYKGQDRRKEPRVTGAVVDYYLEGMDAVKETAFIKDISAGGICIYVYKKIDKSEKIFLHIYLFGNKDAIIVKGEVVWQEVSDYLGYYNLGIRFLDIKDEDQKKLDGFIDAFIPQSETDELEEDSKD